MMAGADGAGKGMAGDKDATAKSERTAKPAYERQQNNNGNPST
jgi:hypothetical protein